MFSDNPEMPAVSPVWAGCCTQQGEQITRVQGCPAWGAPGPPPQAEVLQLEPLCPCREPGGEGCSQSWRQDPVPQWPGHEVGALQGTQGLSTACGHCWARGAGAAGPGPRVLLCTGVCPVGTAGDSSFSASVQNLALRGAFCSIPAPPLSSLCGTVYITWVLPAAHPQTPISATLS